MARNYTIGEATQIIFEGSDFEAIQDLGRRYPILVSKIAKVTAKAGEDFVDIMGFIPEYISANKVNGQMKKALLDGVMPAPKAKEEKPAKKATKKAAKEEVEDDEDSPYASMKGKQLNELIDAVGGRKKCQKEFGDCKNGSMIAYLTKYYPNGVDEEGDDEDDTEDYTEMSEKELLKLCKSRGIKAEKGKKAKYYIGLLEKADAAAEADEDDDDWEEEEVEEKPAKKAPAKKAKKAEPEPEDDDEDDDDDWDI